MNMKFQATIFTFVIILSFSGCVMSKGNEQAEGDTLSSRIEKVENGLVEFTETGPRPSGRKHSISDRMSYYQVPGVSIAIIEDFQIEWAKGYGLKKARGDDPITVDALFNAGSISKMFSAAGALTLVEAGLLDLDQDINKSLVSWQMPENEFTATEKVTLRRLLSHSGGIRDGFTNRSSSDALPGYLVSEGGAPSATIEELLEGAPGVDVDGPTYVGAVPGSEYSYANANYAILELLLTDITDKPFPEFMAESVFEPLDMQSSTFETPLPMEFRKKAVWEHSVEGAPFEMERLHFPFGNLWISPSDLARFVIEIMKSYQGSSGVFLSQKMAKEMLSVQVDIEDHPLADAYGFGFDLRSDLDEPVAFHTGGTWGSTCIVWILPRTGQGAVVMTNSASGSLIRFEILYAIGEAYGWP